MKTEEQARLEWAKKGQESQYKKVLRQQWADLGTMVVPSEQEAKE